MAAPTIGDSRMSSGVDELIARLRDEGVSAGRDKAEKLIAEAKLESRRILDKADSDTKVMLASAHKEAEAYRSAGEAALKTAMRDAVLDMKTALMDRFSSDVERLVSRELQDAELLKKLILAVAGRVGQDITVTNSSDVNVLLPETAVGLDELREDPEELEKGPLTKFVLGLTDEMLRKGVTFQGSDEVAAGIRIQLKDKDIEIDLSDKAVAGLLLRHLQPRFRAILEGIVK